ncbi:TM2 domain-containing protein [Mucilaginibacter sp. Bleaf8]|uniref:TM2 domain-containing protein n=1 Tax=Mucilaginibacter sp. Bleaf8 TaxID=2834430 RepID=UPI001BCE2CA3|nr:TM2 domain-containing protein [Mucilaginibacter sp. Bleaf8]MBS7565857.1 TM2 domain-containing protein [Mucilaginibacter sp. Bleaf8]
MDFNFYTLFSGITTEEMAYLQQATAGLSENQQRHFVNIYGSKRRTAQDLLLFTLLGFIGIAGVHRFLVGQIAMGIIYFFTGGFCGIGTIVDLINHKSLANSYNRDMAYESLQIVKMGGY